VRIIARPQPENVEKAFSIVSWEENWNTQEEDDSKKIYGGKSIDEDAT
jgi:hypothetical protein